MDPAPPPSLIPTQPARSALTELIRRPRVSGDYGECYTLWIHDDNVSTAELVVNPILFPSTKKGDCAAIFNPITNEQIHVAISSIDGKTFKQSSFQLSLHMKIAEQFSFASRRDVYVSILPADKAPKAKYVGIVFRDQYIGRLPMAQIKDGLKGQGAYLGKQIIMENACIRARIDYLEDSDNKPLRSGIISNDPMTTFRSETAKVFILLQLSCESLEWDEWTGMTFLEKAIDGFLADLFDKWHEQRVNHMVSIVMFYRKIESNEEQHKDYYSVAVDWEIHEDWRPVLQRVRYEAARLLDTFNGAKERLLPAAKGNLLEAINLALLIFDKHFVDRDLIKTGMSVICVTPGSGHFIIKGPETMKFSKMAKRKVLDAGVWLQLVCLGKRPLYISPILELFNETKQQQQQSSSLGNGQSKFYQPYWIRSTFFVGKPQWRSKEQVITESTKELLIGTFSDKSASHSCTSFLSLLSITPILAGVEDPELITDDDLNSATTTLTIPPFNPCNLTGGKVKHCQICVQKWALIKKNEPSSFTDFSWDLFIALPCLPLQNKVILKKDLIEKEFELIGTESLKVSQNTLMLPLLANVDNLFQELVATRVALGFQEIQIDDSICTDGKAFLYSHSLHIISKDGEHVNISMYRKKGGVLAESPDYFVDYIAFIRPRMQADFTEQKYRIAPSNVFSYPWADIDQMIAGGVQHEIPGTNYWQSRFILAPEEEAPRSSLIMSTAAHEILDDEELRIAGFLKFIDVLCKISFTNPSPSSKGQKYFKSIGKKDYQRSSIDFLKVLLTTFTSSAWAHQETFKAQCKGIQLASTNAIGENGVVEEDEDLNSVADVEPLTKDADFTKIAVLMQHPLVGISIKNRRWHWKMYKNVFIGNEAVDWILKFFDGIASREEAVEFGDTMIDRGAWEHITGFHRFLDGHYFYRFTAEYDLGTLRKSDPRILKKISSSREDVSLNDQTIMASHSPEFIVMSRSILINIDTQGRSDKREWAILHYDSIHNPKLAFHFRLHWLTCSARLIDDLIQAWSRRASQCGFLLLEAPVFAGIGPRTDFEPFSQALFVNFSILPPSVGELNRRLESEGAIGEGFFVEELLRKHDFILDFEQDDKFPVPDNVAYCLWSYERPLRRMTQYIHRSGVAIVQIAETGLFWSINRLYLSSAACRGIRNITYNALVETEESLRKEMILLCSDPQRLGSFWRETLTFLGNKVGIEPILDVIPDAMAEGSEGTAGSPERIFDRIANLDLELTFSTKPPTY